MYEHSSTSPSFVHLRPDPNYAVLRDIANECANMLTAKSISPAEFIQSRGLTARKKSRMVLQELLDKQTVADYLAESGDAEDAASLREALSAA